MASTNSVVTNQQYLGVTPAVVTASRDFTNHDDGFNLVYSGAGAITLTLPKNLNSGFGCAVSQMGAGQITIAAATGVTLNNVSGQFKTSGQYAVVALVQAGVDSYLLEGATGA